MPKDIRVLLIEDDLYARDLMSLLLTRDWRTRVVGEAGSEDDVKRILKNTFQKINTIVLDTEVPDDSDWPFRVAEMAKKTNIPTTILSTATKANPKVLKRLTEVGFGGYILKREVGYSLAAAVAQAAKHKRWVTTPSIYKLALLQRIQLPKTTVILDGTKPVAKLTPREDEIARLAILFNHAHRDLADELIIRADQVSKHVSNIYTKLGLDDILSGEISPDTFIQDKLVLHHFANILARVAASKSRRKTSDMATLAFHLLTVPEINDDI